MRMEHDPEAPELGEAPKPEGYCTDFAGVLTEGWDAKLEELCKAFFDEQGVQVAIAVVPDCRGAQPADFAFWLYNEWGIGGKQSRGVLLLLAMAERRIESEVGLGLEAVIGEDETQELIDQVCIPLLRDGKYGEALVAGVKRLSEMLS
jgi:uncharacterized protein